MARQKGPKHERNFCKRLSKWWTSGRRDDIFWRTAGSGARATTRAKKGIRTHDSYGDLKAEHVSGKPLTDRSIWSLKRGYTGKKGKTSMKWVSILDLIDSPAGSKNKPAIARWWRELLELQHFTGKEYVFLVFKRDRRDEVIGMLPSAFNNFEAYCGEFKGTLGVVKDQMTSIIFMKTDDFFTWLKPVALGKKMKKVKRRKK